MNITVYCGANLGTNIVYHSAAEQLGKWIAHNGYSLTYGGGGKGLMGIVSSSAYEAGAEVNGIIPKFLIKGEQANRDTITHLQIVDSMPERKRLLANTADVLISLPGGLGTIEEFSEILSWQKINLFNKPHIFYNVAGFYNHFKAFLTDASEAGFISKETLSTIFFAESLEQIDSFITDYVQ